MDGVYGNNFAHTDPEECVNWDGIVMRNGNDFIGDCYVKENRKTYDFIIADTIHYRRFVNIKSCLKLCDHAQETKRGDDFYDPTQKYRHIWDVLIFNLNQFIETADLDMTIDETS